MNKKSFYCPWCGSHGLKIEIVKKDDLHFIAQFSCKKCGMQWDGPLEKEKRYPSGKTPAQNTIMYYINKMITQDYIDESVSDSNQMSD
ncbi:MAG: hypothetical protein GF364_05955 [Candidatus Lokiarchaeota archaeon]|nr:hypothetical protein [Candidatus Lokiarchaeota archaeon]